MVEVLCSPHLTSTVCFLTLHVAKSREFLRLLVFLNIPVIILYVSRLIVEDATTLEEKADAGAAALVTVLLLDEALEHRLSWVF